MPADMDIVFVGAGRLATNFACALHEQGHSIVAVFSRTLHAAETLADRVGAKATCHIDDLPRKADAFVVAVKDDAIATLLPQLSAGREQCCFFHTAGSVPLSVFAGVGIRHYGVVYPMQTFSKERLVDFSVIPVFIEGNDEQAVLTARWLATSVSQHVQVLPSAARKQVHLAAVFACNFVNHCYELSAQLLEEQGLSFSIMHPLVEETARKVMELHPHDAQTGPAVRYDQQVIGMQQQMLAGHPAMREVYELLSRSIHQLHKSS